MELPTAGQDVGNEAPYVQVDLFVNTLRELQEEQALYQQRVFAAQTKRITVEKKLDVVLTKHAAALDKNNKMLGVQRAAEFKTAMAEEESNRLEKSNAEKKAMISQLTDAITAEEQLMLDDLHCFEDSISQLCTSLRTARKYYTCENLTQEISNMHISGQEAQGRVLQGQCNVGVLREELQQLRTNYPNVEDEVLQNGPRSFISAQDWVNIVTMFQEEAHDYQSRFKNTSCQFKTAQEQKERLQHEVSGLEQQLEKKKQECEANDAQRRMATSTAMLASKGRHPISPLVSGPGVSSSTLQLSSRARQLHMTSPMTSSSPSLGSRGTSKYAITVPRLINFSFNKKT